MARIIVNRTIEVASDKVWAALADFGGVHRFHPLVGRVDLLSEANGGVDAVRRCHFYDGTSVMERIVDWQDGRSLRVELSEMSMPLVRASAEIALAPAGAEATRVSVTLDFVPKFGPLGALMSVLMLKPMMRRMFAKLLASLEHHLVTGALIGRGGTPEPVAPPERRPRAVA